MTSREEPPDALRARIEGVLGATAVSWRAVTSGHTEAARWLVGLPGGRGAFVKAATTPETAAWLRTERRVYDAVRAEFLPRMLAWGDDGALPVLVLEDLSGARWPPPWPRGSLERVREALAAVAVTPVPDGLPPLSDLSAMLRGWTRVADDPAAFLSLGIASRAWLVRSLPALLAGESRARLDGESLVHGDVRSDNLCLVGDRAVLVDWNWAARGNPRTDLAFWLPSLASEGGPLPESLLPDGADEAALVSGYFASMAGLPATGSMVRVRALQRRQLEFAFPWAVRALGLPGLPT